MRSWCRIIPPFFLILVLISGFPSVKCVASVAPFWLREGAYAYYLIETFAFDFGNGTTVWDVNGTYGWKCLGVTGDTAVLEVIINIIGRKLGPKEYKTTPYNFTAKYVISIDIETREAFFDDEYLGVLPYWIPTNIKKLVGDDLEKIRKIYDWIPPYIEELGLVENVTSFDNLTRPGIVGTGVANDFETPYRTFKGDELWPVAGAFGNLTGFTIFFEKETGLWIAKGLLDNIWRKVIGVKSKSFESVLLMDTNIHFRPEPTSPFTPLLPYIITAAAIIATTTSIYFIKVRKKS